MIIRCCIKGFRIVIFWDLDSFLIQVDFYVYMHHPNNKMINLSISSFALVNKDLKGVSSNKKSPTTSHLKKVVLKPAHHNLETNVKLC